MLQFFRINDPYRLIVIFLLLTGVRIIWITTGLPLSVPELKWLLIGERLGDGFTMYRELYDYTGPLSALVYKWIDFVFGRSRWVHMVFSTLLVTIQAGILNNILLKNKAYEENNYLPAFFYAVLISSTMDFFALSPPLMAMTFLLLALNLLFRRIDNVMIDELFVYLGIYVGIAACFYLPAIIYFVVYLLSLVLFTTAIFRRLLLYIYGMLCVFLVVWAYFFWYDAGSDFMASFFGFGFSRPRDYYLSYLGILELGAVILAVGAISFSVLFTQRFTNFQQKMQQVMILFFIGGIAVLFISREVTSANLVLLTPTVAFLLAYYFMGLKRKIFRFTLPTLVVGSLLLYPVFWLSNHQDSALIVAEPTSSVTDQRLMGIGVPYNLYLENKISGPFLDEYISRKRLEKLQYYDEASGLYEVLISSDPDVIIDQVGIFPEMHLRFPVFGRRYRETADQHYVKISN